ncbi:hypothetical protein ABIE26_004095 [Pedobacter africanus]|uniref:Uncharacterized protein n=1 Tax=Pedobacter africanus TaxID=151894 RepID=A0ACC6L1U4_9SPHI|nr:hypothetical protein [Pedobacter africanus]
MVFRFFDKGAEGFKKGEEKYFLFSSPFFGPGSPIQYTKT